MTKDMTLCPAELLIDLTVTFKEQPLNSQNSLKHSRFKRIRDASHPVLGGYKYGDLALQVGGVSDETVKYGREFCGYFGPRVTALARPRSNCTVNYRPVLSSERALQNNEHTAV
jgi:hypothetical protein